MSQTQQIEGVEIQGPLEEGFEQILTPAALEFVAELERQFGERRHELLERRERVQAAIDDGQMPDFLPETREIRESEWQIDPLPADLQDRRLEITGPVDRKMVINALNSGAYVFMADLEDSNSPTWQNCIHGQINLRDANRRSITYTNPANGKFYELQSNPATLIVRPRGWHLPEKHVYVDGRPISASLFDFGLYLFHNAQMLLENGSGPYFYLPKLENHLEARLWNDVFVFAQERLGIPQGTIKATVLIENILATFEMHEILYELRPHSAGLNCGRWDYIFSMIKKFRRYPEWILPDRSLVTMTVDCMRAYSLLTIKTCHQRNAPAIGGMAAQIPIKNAPEANEQAMNKVRADKEREASDGHDGTWVAHPGLVQMVLDIFNGHMPQANQIERKREDVQVSRGELLKVPEGKISEHGIRLNINVGIQYLAAWLQGNGCVPIFNLMEDAATAEISRAQLWQWVQTEEVYTDDGRAISLEWIEQLVPEELDNIRQHLGDEVYQQGSYQQAAEILLQMVRSPQFVDFLTLPAYEHLP
jgi:malate synthase